MAGRFLLPFASLPRLFFSPFPIPAFHRPFAPLAVRFFTLSLFLSLSHLRDGWKPKVLSFNVILRYESCLSTTASYGLWSSFLLSRYWGFISSRNFASLPFRWSVRSLDGYRWEVGSLNLEPRLQQSWIDWNIVILSFFFFFSKLQNCLIRQLSILTSTFCAKFERLSKACRRLVYCIFTMYLTNCIIGILYFIFILYFWLNYRILRITRMFYKYHEYK